MDATALDTPDPATDRRDEDSRQAPVNALAALVGSEGHALHLEHVRAHWGTAAMERRVREVLESRPPAEHSAMIQALYFAKAEILKLFKWPEEEVQTLRSAVKPDEPDRFAQHRRIGV